MNKAFLYICWTDENQEKREIGPFWTISQSGFAIGPEGQIPCYEVQYQTGAFTRITVPKYHTIYAKVQMDDILEELSKLSRNNQTTVFVIERDNPDCRPEPEVHTDGKLALKIVQEEYDETLKSLGVVNDDSDEEGSHFYGEWNFSDESKTGDALISSEIDSDRWEWRITSHTINTNKEA